MSKGGKFLGADTVPDGGMILSYQAQVVESIKESFINEHRISKQLNCIGTVNCQSGYVTNSGLKITGISMTHVVGPLEVEHWIENVAYIVDDGKQTILHLGDGMLSMENINKIKQRGEKFDLAVLPYWYGMLDRALPLLDQFMATIKPKKVALIHLPFARLAQLKDQVKSLSYQNIIVPVPGEQIILRDGPGWSRP
jgi:L-ascorbate metabolism protein UlaG (beta-lactamase superfamily)